MTAVINGDCDAGATFVDARTDDQKAETTRHRRNVADPERHHQLRDRTFRRDLQQKITDALLAIAADPDNAQLLSDTYNWGGLIEGSDSFFDDFRQQLDAAGIKIEELAK